MKVQEGTTIIFDLLSWREDWEFDHPSAMLRPFVRIWEDSRSFEGMVEDVCIDACLDGDLPEGDDDDGGIVIIPTLKRRFREAMNGRRFPVKQYQATQVVVQFYRDSDGELAWREMAPPVGELLAESRLAVYTTDSCPTAFEIVREFYPDTQYPDRAPWDAYMNQFAPGVVARPGTRYRLDDQGRIVYAD